METSLVIDRGNSTLKAFIFQGETCIYTDRFLDDAQRKDRLANLFSRFSPTRAIYSSSGPQDPRDVECISSLMHRNPLIFSHSTPIPIRLEYKTPLTLGLDRIAAAVAAFRILQKYPALNFALTADAGTALTLDITEKPGRFVGGNISAGLNLRLRALNRETASLPLVPPEGDCPLFGFDTCTAMRAGAIRGLAAEISVASQQAQHSFGNGIILLTGGDAPTIAPYIESSLQVIQQPALVADGLNSILHYNENIQKAN